MPTPLRTVFSIITTGGSARRFTWCLVLATLRMCSPLSAQEQESRVPALQRLLIDSRGACGLNYADPNARLNRCFVLVAEDAGGHLRPRNFYLFGLKENSMVGQREPSSSGSLGYRWTLGNGLIWRACDGALSWNRGVPSFTPYPLRAFNAEMPETGNVDFENANLLGLKGGASGQPIVPAEPVSFMRMGISGWEEGAELHASGLRMASRNDQIAKTYHFDIRATGDGLEFYLAADGRLQRWQYQNKTWRLQKLYAAKIEGQFLTCNDGKAVVAEREGQWCLIADLDNASPAVQPIAKRRGDEPLLVIEDTVKGVSYFETAGRVYDEEGEAVSATGASADAPTRFTVLTQFAIAQRKNALTTLARLEGDAYTAQRDALLAAHPQPWDVEAAAAHSWQAGLMAHILNERALHPDEFAALDREAEQYLRTAHAASVQRAMELMAAPAPYRLEFAWKPPSYLADLTPTHIDAATKATAGLNHFVVAPEAQEPSRPLLLKLASDCSIPAIRSFAVRSLGRSKLPRDREFVMAIVRTDDAAAEVRYSGIAGLAECDPPRNQQLLLEIIGDRRTEDNFVLAAIDCLGTLESLTAESKSALRCLAADDDRTETVRARALHTLPADGSAETVELFRRLLRARKPSAVQAAAARPWPALRTELRYALEHRASPEVISKAAEALLALGGAEDVRFVEQEAADAVLSEAGRKRIDSELQRYRRNKEFQETRAKWHAERASLGMTEKEFEEELLRRRELAWIASERQKLTNRADNITAMQSADDEAALQRLNEREAELVQERDAAMQEAANRTTD